MEGCFNISNNDNAKFYANSAVGIFGGVSTYKVLLPILKRPYADYYLNMCKRVTTEENSRYYDSAIQAFQNSKHYSPKLTVTNVDRTNWRMVLDDIMQKRAEFTLTQKKNPITNLLTKLFSLKNEGIDQKIKIIAKGLNASFVPFASQVLVNKERLGITTFHEIGHFINRNSKGTRNILAKSRALSILSLPVILLTGLLTPKREEGDEYKNPLGKTATFIKEHCGTLAGLSMLPIILEEGVASINAAKLGKKVLDKAMYKKLNKYNAIAFGSYISGAVILGVCSEIAVTIKDKVSGTKPVKNKD